MYVGTWYVQYVYGDVRKLHGLMHVAALIMQVHDFGHDYIA